MDFKCNNGQGKRDKSEEGKKFTFNFMNLHENIFFLVEYN